MNNIYLGYSLWSNSHFNDVLSDNSQILALCNQLNIDWFAVQVLNTVPSINQCYPIEADYKGQQGPPRKLEAIKKLKDLGKRVMLKLSFHPEEAMGLKPAYGAFWVYDNRQNAIRLMSWIRMTIESISDHFDKGDEKGGIDALCVATESDPLSFYVSDWQSLIAEIKSFVYVPILWAAHSIQPLREQYADKIYWYILIRSWFRWWWYRGKDPYVSLCDELINAGALGSDVYIPENLKSDVTQRILNGRPQQLNKYLDVVGVNLYLTPTMEIGHPASMYRNILAGQLGSVDYVQCIRDYAQGKRLWLTECGLDSGQYKGNIAFMKTWLKETIDAAKLTGAEVLFLWDTVDVAETLKALKGM